MLRESSSRRPYFDEDAPLKPLLSWHKMQAQSPYFARLTKSLPWLNNGRRPLHRIAYLSLRRTLAYFLVASVIGFFISGGVELLTGGWANALDITVAVANAFAFMAVFYLGFTIIFDLMMEFRLLGLSISEAGEWELTRLTLLSRRGIVFSVFAYWRVGFWGTMISIFNYRLVSLYTLALIGAGGYWIITSYIVPNSVLLYTDAGLFQGALVGLILLACIFVLLQEACWRLNGVAALATLFAFAVRQDYLLPARVSALLVSTALQAVFAFASFRLAAWAVEQAYLNGWGAPLFGRAFGMEIEWFLLQVLLCILLFGLCLYLYFRLMRVISLRLAVRVFRRRDGIISPPVVQG